MQHNLKLQVEQGRPGPEDLCRVSWRLEAASPEDVLGWALKTYADGLTLSLSFGGAEGMVLLDMLWRQGARVRIFTLDTGLLFKETLEFRKKIMKRFDLDAEQTDAILELKLYRLARLEILVIQQELAGARKRSRDLNALLNDEPKRSKSDGAR